MAKRMFSMLVTDPEDRARVEDFMARFREEHERAHNAQATLAKESSDIITAMVVKYKIDPELPMFIDTSYHADHGLIILASMNHQEDGDTAKVPQHHGRLN